MDKISTGIMCIYTVLLLFLICKDTGYGAKGELKKTNEYLERIAKALERMANDGKIH